MNGSLLAASALHFSYGNRPVLQGMDLEVHAGEVLALLGANGSGKSTLMRLLLGLLKPAAGVVSLEGRPMTRWSRREIACRVAYVPQSQHVPFPYRVREFVALGRIPRGGLFGRMSRHDQQVVEKALERLAIGHLAERIFTQLSGGQRQLCLIARALVQEAPVIVMDEPDTGLDYGNQWRLISLVRELSREGWAFILSTHHPEHALNGATRALLLHAGRMVANGDPAKVVSAAHIDRLYGLRVNCHKLADGQVVLIPDTEACASYA